jgi:hypothetical protein
MPKPTLPKPTLRVTKWLGPTPVIALCTLCNREFKAPLTVLTKMAEAQESLRLQFAQHRCKAGVTDRGVSAETS